VHADRRYSILRAGFHGGASSSHNEKTVSRDDELCRIPGARVTTEQADGRGGGKIGAAAFKSQTN
jgi:hypothetical protein